jgi:4-amino-4-deoxy-L-arabinose transferase-like glycosyltransferase
VSKIPARLSAQSPVLHVALICLVYAIIVAATIAEKQPWFDEGGYANPAYNLLNHGRLGMPIVFSQREAWPSVDYYTYHMPPLNFLFQAGWYGLFGVGIFQMRALSAVFGLVLVISLYLFARRITANHWVGLLAALIVATDYNITRWAGDGRMDLMSAAFGFAAAAAFVNLRERGFGLAIFVSQVLVVASGLTHPAGILHLVGVLALILFYDRRRVGLRHVLLGVLPYVAGLVGWGAYIIQDIDAFRTQFFGNYAGRGDRVIFMPLAELGRYISPAFGLGENVDGVARLKLLQLIAYWGAALAFLALPRVRAESRAGPIFMLLIIALAGMAILLSGSGLSYLVHIVPLYGAMLAAVIWVAMRKPGVVRWAAVLVVAGLVAIQAGGPVAKYFLHNSYRTGFAPTVERIAELRRPGDVIIASSEFGFAFGFEGEVVDDFNLGTRDDFIGDIVVIGSDYDKVYNDMKLAEPERYERIVERLNGLYDQVFDGTEYDVYVLKQRRGDPA